LIPNCDGKFLAESRPKPRSQNSPSSASSSPGRWDKFFTMDDPPDYEPGPEKSVAAIAARTNHTPDEIAYDYIVEQNQYLFFPGGELRRGRPRADPPNAQRPGLPARPERRRRALHLDSGFRPAEFHAGALGSATAAADRGCPLSIWSSGKRAKPPTSSVCRIAVGSSPGLRADVNIIDFDRLRLHKPELVHDMPAGGRRFVQRVDGYEATLAAGIPIFERGEHTGAMPGRLVRAGHNGHR
jgi:hypothetical protein